MILNALRIGHFVPHTGPSVSFFSRGISSQQNEEALKRSIEEYKSLLQRQENKYLALKKLAEERLMKLVLNFAMIVYLSARFFSICLILFVDVYEYHKLVCICC